jgi:hypothetical protein
MKNAGEKVLAVVAWHNSEQVDKFCEEWKIKYDCADVVFQHDVNKEGCAVTKNKGVEEAMRRGADVVVVLDDDCFPFGESDLRGVLRRHCIMLAPARVERFRAVTEPISRGTPYKSRELRMPVAASMGFWVGVGDYDAPAQLVRGAETPMDFKVAAIFGDYFPLCGMNLAFRPREWLPWCKFIDVPRFDDIWMGWLWQREAYRRGYCFSLTGPIVRHSRQSNVWQNLRDEAKHLERNETLWADIATHPSDEYASLRKLLPV